jgi:hypothetical protein
MGAGTGLRDLPRRRAWRKGNSGSHQESSGGKSAAGLRDRQPGQAGTPSWRRAPETNVTPVTSGVNNLLHFHALLERFQRSTACQLGRVAESAIEAKLLE